MQLAAYGAQDIYLSGNPQITFFKVVYRRHTNFAMESSEQTFNGQADFGKKVTCLVSRNGDLIHKVYLRVELPTVRVPANAAFRWLNWVGHILIKNVEIDIGGQRIDKHYGDWLHIWNELSQTTGRQLGYANMVGNTPSLVNPFVNLTSDSKDAPGDTLYIPLEFWFCRNAGLALPLIALQYHEVKINLELAPVTDLYWAGTRNSSSAGGWATNLSLVNPGSLNSVSLFVDYIYLDTDERRRFAQVSHEYLIEQLQFTGDESAASQNNKYKLNFNHPCKELIWVVQPNDNVDDSYVPLGKQWFNYTDAFDTSLSTASYLTNLSSTSAGTAEITVDDQLFEGGSNPVLLAKLQLNGHDRFSERDGKYFNLVQPYQHHTNVPATGINVFSFALQPEQHQPSGSCNMSRIDNAVLNVTLTPKTVQRSGGAARGAKVRIYTLNYNVLRIMSGMGGLNRRPLPQKRACKMMML